MDLSIKTNIDSFKNWLASLNASEALFCIVLISLFTIPHSLGFAQHWVNLMPLKYIYIGVFLSALYIYRNSLIQDIKANFRIFSIFGLLFIVFYLRNGYIEISFIPLCMTIFLLFKLSKAKINLQKISVLVNIVALILIAKFFLYSWVGVRYNSGLGNPNHAGLMLCAFLTVLVFSRKYLFSSFVIFNILVLKSYAAILCAFSIVTLFFLLKSSFLKSLLIKSNMWIVSSLSLIFLLLYIGVFYRFHSEKLPELRERMALHLLNYSYEDGENSEITYDENGRLLNYSNSVFDLSGFTRVYQFEGFTKNYSHYILIGDENQFVKKTGVAFHNNVLGMTVIFGLLGCLIYINLVSTFVGNKAVFFLPFVPIFGSDSPINFYGIYFVFIYLCILTIPFECTKTEN